MYILVGFFLGGGTNVNNATVTFRQTNQTMAAEREGLGLLVYLLYSLPQTKDKYVNLWSLIQRFLRMGSGCCLFRRPSSLWGCPEHSPFL